MSIFSQLKSFYEFSPSFVKDAVRFVPFTWLAGKEYRNTAKLLKRLDYASKEEIDAYQAEQLTKILSFATEHVPFYKPYKQYVQKYPAPEAIKFFPLIEKKHLQNEFDSFIPDCINKIPHRKSLTGGSTGNQLKFYEDWATIQKEIANIHYQWKRIGYTPDSRKVTFRGVSFPQSAKGIYWKGNPVFRELFLSPFHLNISNIGAYVEQFRRFSPQFVHGYPSAIRSFVDLVTEADLQKKIPSIKAVLLCSEGCPEEYTAKIQSFFNCRVYSHYGQSERVILAGECENSSSYYHAIPSYGYLEMIKEDGSECLDNEFGEIVGTGFMNYSMPLIRYKTDDFATKIPISTCACGRNHYTFSKVRGRWGHEAFVYGKNGSKISAAALNMHGDLYRNVIRYQYYQSQYGKLEIRVIPNQKFSEEDARIISAKHQEKLGNEITLEVRCVEDIPLTPSGKQRILICDLK